MRVLTSALASSSFVVLVLLAASSLEAQRITPSCQTGCLGGVQVTPDGGTDAHPMNTGPWSLVFTVKNTGTSIKNFTFSCSPSGGVTCVSVVPASAFMDPAEQLEVTVTYNLGATNGQLGLLASATGSSDDGYYTVSAQGAPAITLRKHNGDNRDRSLCLTSGAGEAAAWQCGDLVVTHGLPGYATMGRDRSLTLLYNSAQAVPKPVVAAAVDQVNRGQPNTVFVRLLISGVARDSATYTGWAPLNPTARQVVLAHDATADSSGIYPITLAVRNQYSGAAYETTVSDTMIVVNRAASRFGAGWSLMGVEELRTGQPGNKILWIGGDGSAKVYRNVNTTTWAAAAAAYRDTLVQFDSLSVSWYRRTLRHGITVTFDAAGHHVRTTNRVGQFTRFFWSGSPARLDSIGVPPSGVTGTIYRLVYDGNGKLDKITDPAGRALDATVTSNRLASLLDPDTRSTGFVYDAAGRMTGRTTRRGFKTSYVYGAGLRVDTVKVPLNISTGDTARTAFRPWDEQGLAATQGATGQIAVDTALVYTRIDGPRTSVADTAEFWVDRWGGPIQTRDPLGAVTTMLRGSATVPALVTQVTGTDGRITKMTWDAHGNLTQLRDSTAHLTNGQPTAVTRWTYLSANTKDAPDSVIDPEGIVSRYTYNTWGLVSDATAPNGHVTHVDFVTSGTLIGLVQAVTEQSVPAWDTTSKSEPTANLRAAFAFNTLGNVLSDTSPAGRVRVYTRDSVQRVTNVYDPAAHRVEMVYDPLNRLLQSIQHVEGIDSGFAAALVTRQHYDIDVLDSIIDPRNVTRRYQYDAANRPTAEIDDYGHVETTYYDRAGLVDSIRPRFYSDTTGKVIRYSFDAAGRVSKKAWPSREELSADSTHWIVTAAADSILYTYDVVGRMLTAAHSGRKIVRTYYPTGTTKSEVQSAADGSGPISLTYAYDRAGRQTWYRNGTSGNLTYSDSIWYRYASTTGELQWVGVRWRQPYAGAPPKDSILFRWDALGRRDTVAYTNGARVKFAYDADGMLRLVCSAHTGGPTNEDVFDFTYYHQTVDVDGMIRASTNFNPTIAGCAQNNTLLNTYAQTYDSRHQLRTQTVTGSTTSYAYDGSGNIVRAIGPTTVQNTIHYMALGHNRIDSLRYAPTPNDGRNFYYDWNGGRIDEVPVSSGVEDPSGLARRQYWYDGLGRTAGTSEYVCPPMGGNCLWNDDRTACKYDPMGRLYDACQNGAPLLGYDGENAVRTSQDQTAFAWSFVQGPGLDDPLIGYYASTDAGNSKYWYWVTDGQGRQFAVGDATGNTMTSDNWYTSNGGKYAGGSRNANTFGIERNGSAQMNKLSVFRNRFYDQQTGRWTQEDPIGVAGGMNQYSYVGNNPVMFTDPFGLCPDSLKNGKGLCPGELSDKEYDNVERAAKDHLSLVARNRVLGALSSGRIRGGSLGGDEAHVSGSSPDVIRINRNLKVFDQRLSVFNWDPRSLARILAHEDRHVQQLANFGFLTRILGGSGGFHMALQEDADAYADVNVRP
jgi:RHS repeat-associated protein